MYRPPNIKSRRQHALRPGFSIAELLVVIGILALLIAIVLPPLQLARRQAMDTHCRAQLNQLGLALEGAQTEYGFYPLWDDAGAPVRYTWIDVLIQLRYVGESGGMEPKGRGSAEAPKSRIGYCAADLLPDPLNAARNSDLIYPLNRGAAGVDYSYGIGVPLSAGGWAWRQGYGPAGDDRPRRFRDHQRYAARRVLAGDAYAAAIYNLGGRAFRSGIWNDPTQYDNTVAWARHAIPATIRGAANLLFQDGHVTSVVYEAFGSDPVNTAQYFVWYPGEPLTVGPDHQRDSDWYPFVPPPSFQSNPRGDVFPIELTPYWYTYNHRWTRVVHK